MHPACPRHHDHTQRSARPFCPRKRPHADAPGPARRRRLAPLAVAPAQELLRERATGVVRTAS
eukprot:9268427-Alexandrium_andersonii.AAC.1